MKHTPGPWKFRPENGEVYFDDSDGDDVQPGIATIHEDNVDPHQYIADCRLIAAAPDMLEALKLAETILISAVHPFSRWPGDGIDQIRATIAKAEGRD